MPKTKPVNSFCQACAISVPNYQKHLISRHRMVYCEPRRIKRAFGECYCIYCDQDFSDEPNYDRHLMIVHKAAEYRDKRKVEFEPRILNPHLQPDIRDCNHYCQTCDHSSIDMTAFKSHLRQYHQVEMPKPSSLYRKRLAVLPDLNNPSYYCKTCDKQFPKALFAYHCFSQHKVCLPGGFFDSMDKNKKKSIQKPFVTFHRAQAHYGSPIKL